MINIKTSLCLLAAMTIGVASMNAGETKTYRASGNFITITDSMLVLRTKAMDLELIRDAKTKVHGTITKGVAASITYDKINGQPHATEITVTPGSGSTVIN